MTRFRTLLLLIPLCAIPLHAQVSGNRVYDNSYRSSSNSGRQLVNYLTDSTFLITADLLMNVKADEFVAVFGVSQDGASVDEANREVNRRIAAFQQELKTLGIREDDLFTDMIAQNRIFDYKVTGKVATEEAQGFEVKKNVSIHYKDHQMIEKLVLAAAKHDIFDLVKVDYQVNDPEAIHNALLERAQQVIARKKQRYEAITGVPATGPAEIFADDFSARYPGNAYRQYSAFESSDISGYDRSLTVKSARKSRTFYFDSIDLGPFDAIINPTVLEPVVQFTLTLAVRYRVGK